MRTSFLVRREEWDDLNQDSGNETEEQENPNEYCEGGYHHLRIGDKLHKQRYSVIRKIGWGTFSTVWLCFDQRFNKYVAIKIVKSKKSIIEAALDEIDLLQIVAEADADPNANDPFGDKVIKLLNHFTIRGLNGKREYFS